MNAPAASLGSVQRGGAPLAWLLMLALLVSLQFGPAIACNIRAQSATLRANTPA
jgi:hypothetical protein